ncbi:hypothetical protein AN478_01305 [Thiohalorhabdus denitrificans]|uniref:Uncharacterized protein n=1 Tax=Thiohalorhabdus denitrificans TaxID=381306 RepID=A0A0P9CQW5_9GAMM|nr:hypothetical protein [Thiohalorhabdus denitrificans]KPV41734.1 hypothetical protein AN478_01305 [Thiohalorhabdus denitrificans]SCY53914.1 hypothetical protein SAMN05661077_2407 [Thiohalorhabdus denitrificans]
MALAWPAAVPAAEHPEGTRIEQETAPVDLVRLQVVDKVEGRRWTMPIPEGLTTSLPDAIHRVRITGYTEALTLEEPPRSAEDEGDAEAGEERPDPVSRADGEDNPAVFLQLFRGEELVGESWILQRTSYLFQPSNMRYTFRLLGVDEASGKEN